MNKDMRLINYCYLAVAKPGTWVGLSYVRIVILLGGGGSGLVLGYSGKRNNPLAVVQSLVDIKQAQSLVELTLVS